MNRIYRYDVNCGRMGSIQGVFAVNDDGETCLRALIESRRDVYFGEVLGKHSEVIVSLADKELTLLTSSPEDVASVLRVFSITPDRPFAVISGFCPFVCDDTYEIDTRDPDALLAWARGEDV